MHHTTKTMKLSAFGGLAAALLFLGGCGQSQREATKPNASKPEARKPDESKPAAPGPADDAAREPLPASIPEGLPVQPPEPDESTEAAPEQPAAAADEPREPIAAADAVNGVRQSRIAFYRADAEPAEVPAVALSTGHESLCRVKVGDPMPEIALPQLGARGRQASLADLAGEKATVVVFWSADRRMAREQLADLPRDVVEPFGEHGLAVVGIAVKESAASAAAALEQADARFPNLLDAEGDAFAKVGSERLPRTYLLDADGRILWFDIEYSLSTRRELHDALRAVTKSR